MTTVVISYLVYLLLVGGFGLAGVYHAKKFGFPGDKTTLATVVYLFVIGAIVIGTFVALGQAGGEA